MIIFVYPILEKPQARLLRELARGAYFKQQNTMQNNGEFAGNANLFPIILHEGVQVVDSRLIAEYLGIEHSNFMETIKKHQEKIEANFGALPFQTGALPNKRYRGSNTIKFVLLTEDQALFIATLSRNTEQVVDFKAKVIASFSQARKTIQEAEFFLQQVAETFATEEYVNDYFEKLFAMANILIANSNIFDKNFKVFRGEMDKLADKIGLVRETVDFLQKKMQKQTLQIEQLEQAVGKLQARQDAWENTHTHQLQRIDEIEQKVMEIMQVFGIGADCFVYVFYNPQTRLYKLGRSKHIGKRKQDFQTVQKELVLKVAIPTRTREEAIKLENTLQQRFVDKVRHGEWYALEDFDLAYLQGLQQLNQEALANLKNTNK
ncbi:MAG: hypothetical protein EAZ95_15825 [Bacteroidetes bacterium]|nr:MAG: hypothetical protein EAZ95_15825 [Bacteroidota bacterium]